MARPQRPRIPGCYPTNPFLTSAIVHSLDASLTLRVLRMEHEKKHGHPTEDPSQEADSNRDWQILSLNYPYATGEK